MRKYAKILAIVFILVVLSMSFMACSFKYGEPDSLHMADASVGERILVGLQVAMLGVGVVFVVLLVLIGFIILFKYGFKYADILKAKLSSKKVAKPAKVEEVKTPVIEGLDNEDEEMAAVITAAIMAYYDQQAPVYTSNLKFRVRNISEIK